MKKIGFYLLTIVFLALPALSYDYVVVGENAAPSDVFAAAKLATALSTTAAGNFYPNLGFTVIGDAYQFREEGNMLEGSENISHVKDYINSKELNALGNETLRTDSGDFAFTQRLILRDGGYSTFDYATDIPRDDERIPMSYFVFPIGQKLYKYVLEFTKPLIARSDGNASYRLDIKDEEITLLGKRFKIIDAEHPAKDHIRLTLLEEEKHANLKEGDSVSFTINSTKYDIKLLAVDDVSKEAKFAIDGIWSPSIPKGGTFSSDTSLYLYVNELIQNEAPDQRDFAEIILSNRKITLQDYNITNSTSSDAEWYVNDEKIKDTNMQIIGADEGLIDGGDVQIGSIEAFYTPRNTYFAMEKQKLSDILLDKESLFLEAFDFLFVGSGYATNPMEAIVLEPIGRYRYNLNLQNKKGDFLQIPLFFNDNGRGTASDDFERFGDSNNNLIVEESRQIALNDYFIVTSDSYEGQTKARGITRLLRYKGQDNISKTLRFEDVATGEDIESNYQDTSSSINLDSRYLVNVTYSKKDGNISADLNSDGSIDSGDEVLIVTMFGNVIKLDTTFYDRLEFTTKDLEFGIFAPLLEGYAPYGDTKAHDTMRISIGNDSNGYADIVHLERCLSGNPVSQAAIMDTVCYPTFTDTLVFMLKYDALDMYLGTDEYGSYIQHFKKQNEPDNASIYTTQRELETIFFLTAGEIGILEGPPEGKKVSVITDTKALELNASFISVGGPCANKLTAKLMNILEDCEKLFTKESITDPYNGNLVIAGFTAEQTSEAVESYSS